MWVIIVLVVLVPLIFLCSTKAPARSNTTVSEVRKFTVKKCSPPALSLKDNLCLDEASHPVTLSLTMVNTIGAVVMLSLLIFAACNETGGDEDALRRYSTNRCSSFRAISTSLFDQRGP